MGFFTGLIYEKDEYLVFIEQQIQPHVSVVESDLREEHQKLAPTNVGDLLTFCDCFFFFLHYFSIFYIFKGLEIACLCEKC